MHRIPGGDVHRRRSPSSPWNRYWWALIAAPFLVLPALAAASPAAAASTITLDNNAEGGTSGTTVTVANSGGNSGNAFNTVSIGTGATAVFDGTEAAHGGLSYAFATGSTAAIARVQWTAAMGTQTQVWYRAYLYFNSDPAAAVRVLDQDQSHSASAVVVVLSSGKLQVRTGAAGTQTLTTTNTIPLHQWFRIEGYTIGSATAGQVQLELFKIADSTTPDETDTSASTINTYGAMDTYNFGVSTNTANVAEYWEDDIAVSNAGYIGPAGTLPPPPVTLGNSAEGGTSGTTVTTSNSGGSSGNAFDVVNVGPGATGTFDSTEAAHGGLSYAFATGPTAALARVQWTTSMGTQTQVWYRAYLYFNSDPAATVRVVNQDQGVTACAVIVVLPTGKLQIRTGTAGAQTLTTTNTIPLHQWFRIEGYPIGSPSAGQVQLKLFKSADSTTPDETDTSAPTINTNGAMNTYNFGVSTYTANVAEYWEDDIGVSNVGYLGPGS
jgi:hypothetical protein